jgi:hypothetical protein
MWLFGKFWGSGHSSSSWNQQIGLLCTLWFKVCTSGSEIRHMWMP